MHAASSATRSMPPRAFRTRRRRRGGRVWLVAAMTLLLVAVALASRTPISQAFDLSHAATQTPTPDPAARLPGWTLVWWDEFAGPRLDQSKWTVVSDAPGGFHHCCLNNTGNAWIANDVTMVEGSLRLTTEGRAFGGYAYTSGAVTTQGKFDYLYGRLDIRARVPRGNGLWPAFWLLPSNMPSAAGNAS
jgi:beta-glucanase (GH16 family)